MEMCVIGCNYMNINSNLLSCFLCGGGQSWQTHTATSNCLLIISEKKWKCHSVPEELQDQEEVEDQEQLEGQGDKVVCFAQDVITFHNN